MFPTEADSRSLSSPPAVVGEAATSPGAVPAAAFFPAVYVGVDFPTPYTGKVELWVNPPVAWLTAHKDAPGVEQLASLIHAWSLVTEDGAPVPIGPAVIEAYMPARLVDWLWAQWREHYEHPLDAPRRNGSGPSTPPPIGASTATPTTPAPSG